MMVSDIAIIGDGPAALACFAQLGASGVAPSRIAVYGDSPHPLARLERYARAIGQRRMRSEGNGHLSPAEFPGLATIDAWRRRSPWPLLATLFDWYRPSLDLLLAHSAELARRCGFVERKIAARISRVLRRADRARAFLLYDQENRLLGAARHLVLALGHAGLAWPAALEPWRDHPLVAHAYQAPILRPGARVVVIGGGMAAAHVWLNALACGCRVVALHRRPLRRQTLNAPRCAFSAPGIDAYRQLGVDERRTFHAQRHSSFPRRYRWELALWRASRTGMFISRQVEVMRATFSGADATLALTLSDGTTETADMVICATGFRSSVYAHPLIARLVDTYALPLVDGMLCSGDDFTLPVLNSPDNTCGVIGVLARWTLPIADTFVGMKYVARRLAPLLSITGSSCA